MARLNRKAAEKRAAKFLRRVNNVLLVIGSSTPAGYGTTSGVVGVNGIPTANSWVGLYRARLADASANHDMGGWEVVNAGVSGWASDDVINSFYEPVAGGKPSLRSPAMELPAKVFLSITVGSEGLATGNGQNGAIARKFVRRIYRYREMCRQIGADLIVNTQFGRDYFDATTYQFVRQVNNELEFSDIPLVDFRGAIDKPEEDGKMRAGCRFDDLHANNNGHIAIARAIPASFLDRVGRVHVRPQLPNVARGIVCPAGGGTGGTTGGAPLSYNVADVGETPLGSWTLSFKMRSSGASTAFAFAYMFGGTNRSLRLRTQGSGGGIELVRMSESPTTLIGDATYNPVSNTAEQTISVSFDYYDNTVSLYRNGVLVGASDALATFGAEGVDFTRFDIGGRHDDPTLNCVGFTFRDIALYRSRLTKEQHEALHRGSYPKASLEIFSPLADSVFRPNRRIQNLAPTAAALYVGCNAELIPAKVL